MFSFSQKYSTVCLASLKNTVRYVYLLSKYSTVCLPPIKIQYGMFTSYQNTVRYVYLLLCSYVLIVLLLSVFETHCFSGCMRVKPAEIYLYFRGKCYLHMSKLLFCECVFVAFGI